MSKAPSSVTPFEQLKDSTALVRTVPELMFDW
ncbi:hypothetical protein FBY31_0274 [Arthrobacter sp. SLBN-100]|nr:hypothetical protein FBY31_0274 [Arthrobacter sp. SLBN-100]